MKHFHCPIKNWDCPYCKHKTILEGEEEYWVCMMEDPYYEGCDSFHSMYGDSCPQEDYTDDTNSNDD